jgi:hypothetical protein
LEIYEELERKLKHSIKDKGAITVSEIWGVFKAQFLALNESKHETIVDLGVQSELYLGSEFSPPCYYFAFHYEIEYEEDGERYQGYELVYCEFDLSGSSLVNGLSNQTLDLWLNEYSQKQILKEIESWNIFKLFENSTFELNVYGTEV